MNKKFKILLCVVSLVSMIMGCYIGVSLFRTSFLVYEYNNSITSCEIQFGKIVSSCGGSYIGSEPLIINLDGVRTNKQAIERIEEQVNKAGGQVISVHHF